LYYTGERFRKGISADPGAAGTSDRRSVLTKWPENSDNQVFPSPATATPRTRPAHRITGRAWQRRFDTLKFRGGNDMAITPSQRQPREWPLLVLALALVFTVCGPLWQWLSLRPVQDASWAPAVERAGRLLLGPEQIACYCCFTWGSFILLSRYLELRRQRRAF